MATRAETTRREVDPLRVFVLEGYGYLEAWCYSAQALRTFRLDRIAAVEVSDTRRRPHDVALRDLSSGWFEALRDAPAVTLALSPQAGWVAEYYPNESVTYAEDGSSVLTMRVTDPAWLRGLLLRLGGAARVLAPEGAGDSAAEAAQEALDQYAAVFAASGSALLRCCGSSWSSPSGWPAWVCSSGTAVRLTRKVAELADRGGRCSPSRAAGCWTCWSRSSCLRESTRQRTLSFARGRRQRTDVR